MVAERLEKAKGGRSDEQRATNDELKKAYEQGPAHFWTLNYGGGSPELWTAIQTYFNGCYSLSVNTNPPASSVVTTGRAAASA